MTARLVIRPMSSGDAGDLHAVYSDGEAMRFLAEPSGSMEETRRWMRSKIDQHEATGLSLWSVIERASGTVIGDCGIQLEACPGEPEPGVGFRFARAWWGQGYGTEAAAACVAAGFESLDAPRIIGVTKAANAAARRVLENVGMAVRGDASCWGEDWAWYAVERGGVA